MATIAQVRKRAGKVGLAYWFPAGGGKLKFLEKSVLEDRIEATARNEEEAWWFDRAEVKKRSEEEAKKPKTVKDSILTLLRGFGPLTDRDLYGALSSVDQNTIRPRRLELEREGRIVCVGTRKQDGERVRSKLWKVVV